MKNKKPQPRFGMRHPRLDASVVREEAWGDLDDGRPNMRLSRAFVFVLLLHLIAAGGMLAFHVIERNDPGVAETKEKSKATPPPKRGETRKPNEPKESAASTDIPEPAVVIPTAPTPAPAPPETPDTIRYTMLKGDTLSSVGRKFSVTVAELQKMNPQVNPVDIPINSVILVPRKKDVVPRARVVENAATADGYTTYVVKKGDNPYNIAKRFGITQKELEELNNIRNPRAVPIGARLKVPVKR